MSWYKVTLSDADIAARKHMEMRDIFQELFVIVRWPKDAAVYGTPESWNHDYYFSPGATVIALPLIVSYSGVECEAPARSSLRPLLVAASELEIPFAPER